MRPVSPTFSACIADDSCHILPSLKEPPARNADPYATFMEYDLPSPSYRMVAKVSKQFLPQVGAC